jgi:hypothetical protein
VVADVAPEAVWAVVADPTRVGEWSHECRAAEWIDGATTTVPGARFRGGNRQGRTSWHRVSEVVAIDPPREIVWRTVPSRIYRDSTEWTIRVEPVADGDTSRTRLVQSFRVLQLNPVIDRVIWFAMPAHRDRTAALRSDLERLAQVAAHAGAPASSEGIAG